MDINIQVTTNCNVLQESHCKFPCIFDSIRVTSIDLTLLMWSIFSILFQNSVGVEAHSVGLEQYISNYIEMYRQPADS